MKIIDSHLHLFNVDVGKYDWLAPENPPFWPDKSHIAKSFSEDALRLDDNLALAGFVHIEAGFDNQHPWREIDYLIATCKTPFSAVAGFDLLDEQGESVLRTLRQRKHVVGVRHILDDAASEILTAPKSHDNFSLLENAGFCFDAQLSLGDSKGVEALVNIARRYPRLSVVINHAGFPLAASEQKWRDSLQALAACENVAIKLSGWEMHERQWQVAIITPWIARAIQQFGEDRVMLGSNFPLCTWRMQYAEYWSVVLACIPAHLQSKLAYHNTQNWYRVDVG
ncbi:amidohydrolase [Aestuariibacter sp. A3R04]|uniref:amidohydrolase family protein n=1 Tax=Aestuariibacter sp. A3R04 TaxID=2841571 RepID=UPI001C09C153|nr:amidohydrolase family protein [Aestuariibacter sp. A3R04]MBU3021033.1 amidohydrolase [Aestuariibacter sp. A3R04]